MIFWKRSLALLAVVFVASMSTAQTTTKIKTLQLWDDLSLRIERSDNNVQGNPQDISAVKRSLIGKILRGEFVRLGDALTPSQLTDAWGKGFNFDDSNGEVISFFVAPARTGVRFEMAEGSHEDFLSALLTHIKTTNRDIGPVAIEGYMVVASQEYEIAIMKWKNQEAMTNAFTNHAARTGPQLTVLFDPNLALRNGWEVPILWP